MKRIKVCRVYNVGVRGFKSSVFMQWILFEEWGLGSSSVGCPNSLVNEIHEDLSWGKRLDVLLKREDITILFIVPDTVIV